jgi:hypothetical protein
MSRHLDAFTRAYVEAALWSSSDESDDRGGEPLDANYGPDDIDPKTMEAMRRVCADFVQKYGHLIEDDNSRAIDKWGRWELAGHDLWLTSAGHGAGFGDGNFPKHDDKLYEAAKSTKGFELYVGDDGVIYASGEEPPLGTSERRSSHRDYPVVRDFDSVDALVEHARDQDGATHVSPMQSKATPVVLYYPTGRYWPSGEPQYEAGRVWKKEGYWHTVAPGKRTALTGGLPSGSTTIDAYLSRGGGRAPGHAVRDYVPVDNRGRPLSTKDYEEAKRRAERAGGYVKFDTGRPQAMEAFGRGRAWPDWQILDAIDKGHAVPPESEARAAKLAQLGFIDTTGTWRLTAKGRRAIEQRVPVAAEAGAKRGRGRPKDYPSVTQIADILSKKVDGGKAKPIPGGFRWSEKNEAAQFTTYSPEHNQKVVCVVALFEDGSTAVGFFSDEWLSGTDTYENITHFTYPGADYPEMVKDINWVKKTVDGYAASWQPDEDTMNEARPRPKRSAHHPRRRTTR